MKKTIKTIKHKKGMYTLESENHLYIFRDGELVYKRWIGKNGKKSQPSILINTNGWPNEWIV